MPKFELHKVAIINPLNDTEIVILSTILEGAGGATRAFVEEEPESYVTEDNQDIKDSQVYTFTMAGKPTADIAQLRSWIANSTKVTIVGYAYNEALYIENAYLTFLVDPSERKVWKIQARKAGGVDYVDGKLDTEFMMSPNLLNMYKWEDGGSGIPAGWSKTGGTTTFSNGELTFTTTAVTTQKVTREIYFPFSGKDVTFFFSCSSITGTPDFRINIDTISGIGSSSIRRDVATGLNSYTVTLPDNVSRVEVTFEVVDGEALTVSNPGLSIGTSTEYIAR